MKYIQTMLPVVCLLIVGGAIGMARADDRDAENQGVTLYTPVDGGDHFECNAVNVSEKTLSISFAIINVHGNALSCDSPITCINNVSPATVTTNPTPEFIVPPGTAADLEITRTLGKAAAGYCQVAVSGTGNRNDVRVRLFTTFTTTIPGTTTPVFVFRAADGH
jgi:hypothetical protein